MHCRVSSLGTGEDVVQCEGYGNRYCPDRLLFVFDKFCQVDSWRTRTQNGIGIGLYIVKSFTDLLGGSVMVNGVLGQGTSVHGRVADQVISFLRQINWPWGSCSLPLPPILEIGFPECAIAHRP